MIVQIEGFQSKNALSTQSMNTDDTLWLRALEIWDIVCIITCTILDSEILLDPALADFFICEIASVLRSRVRFFRVSLYSYLDTQGNTIERLIVKNVAPEPSMLKGMG